MPTAYSYVNFMYIKWIMSSPNRPSIHPPTVLLIFFFTIFKSIHRVVGKEINKVRRGSFFYVFDVCFLFILLLLLFYKFHFISLDCVSPFLSTYFILFFFLHRSEILMLRRKSSSAIKTSSKNKKKTKVVRTAHGLSLYVPMWVSQKKQKTDNQTDPVKGLYGKDVTIAGNVWDDERWQDYWRNNTKRTRKIGKELIIPDCGDWPKAWLNWCPCCCCAVGRPTWPYWLAASVGAIPRQLLLRHLYLENKQKESKQFKKQNFLAAFRFDLFIYLFKFDCKIQNRPEVGSMERDVLMMGLLASAAAVPGPGPDPPVVMNSTLSLLPISPLVLAGSCKRNVNNKQTQRDKLKNNHQNK